MSQETRECATLFADITDSTRLYDQNGDELAKQSIDICLQIMSEVTEQNKGVVVKTIGDAIMSTFPDVDSAYSASCSMHDLVGSNPQLQKLGMSIQIGFHFGSVIIDKDDFFGDSVNVASRVASMANAKKTLITDEVVILLARQHKEKVRHYDKVNIKGKLTPINIWEVLWQKEDDTDITQVLLKMPEDKVKFPVLNLFYDDQKYQIEHISRPFVIGRSDQASLQIISKSVSRNHCVIEFNRNKYKVIDKSTNGTYIIPKKGKTIFLKNEHAFLLSQGEISLGNDSSSDDSVVIQFSLSE